VFSRITLKCAMAYLLAIRTTAQSSAPQEPPALLGTWVLRVSDISDKGVNQD